MKKISILLICSFIISIAAWSQAYEANIQYDKKKEAAIVIDYAYSPQAVENAIVQRMEKLGYRAKEEKGILNKDKGFLVFKNAYVTDISKGKMDFIIKVERKSKKESDEAVLYMIMKKGDENAMGKMAAYDIGKAKSYLNEMLPDIEAANLELQIIAQEEIVAKAEKKLKGLQDDRTDLEKKLAENAKSQDETIKNIEAQKQSLEILRGKRKKD